MNVQTIVHSSNTLVPNENPDINLKFRQAADKGDIEAIKDAIAHGKVDINSSGESGNTALHNACRKGHLSVIEELLKSAADITKENKQGKIPLQLTKPYSEACAIMKRASELKFRQAADKGDLEAIKSILTYGIININGSGESGNTALHYACRKGYPSVIEELLKAGADIARENKQSKLPLQLTKANSEEARTMMTKASELKFRQDAEDGKTTDIIDAIKLYSIEVNNRGESQNTALHYACRRGRLSTIYELVNAGADLTIRNRAEKAPVDLAPRSHEAYPVMKFTTAASEVHSAWQKILRECNNQYNPSLYSELFKQCSLTHHSELKNPGISGVTHSPEELLQDVYKKLTDLNFDNSIIKAVHANFTKIDRLLKTRATLRFALEKKVLLSSCEMLSRIVAAYLTFVTKLDCLVAVVLQPSVLDKAVGHAFVVLNSTCMEEITTKPNVLIVDPLYNRFFFTTGDQEIIQRQNGVLPDLVNPMLRWKYPEYKRIFLNEIDKDINLEKVNEAKPHLSEEVLALLENEELIINNIIQDLNRIFALTPNEFTYIRNA
jgi:ankyrin repeat protein